MSNGLGVWAVIAGVVSSMGLMACGSSSNSHEAGGGAGSPSAGGAANVGGRSGTGGVPAGGRGSQVAGTGGVDPGDASNAKRVTLNFSWSTYELRGTTKTPVTCADLGAQTVGFTISGDALTGAEKLLISNGEFCATGSFENYTIKLPPGQYYLGVSLSAGLASDSNLKGVASGLSSFTVSEATTHVDIPEVKLVRILFPLTWSINKGGSPSACADVGATEVEFLLAEIRENFMSTISWSDPCTATPTDNLVTPGSFQLTANLKAGGSTLATWTAPQRLEFSTDSAAIPPAITFEVP